MSEGVCERECVCVCMRMHAYVCVYVRVYKCVCVCVCVFVYGSQMQGPQWFITGLFTVKPGVGVKG